jgi:hypothetical protein
VSATTLTPGRSWTCGLATTLCLVALSLGRPEQAAAAPCPSDLTVAGVPVTGDDCVTLGDGRIQITAPKLLASKAVNITTPTGNPAKMILSLDRSQLLPEQLVAPLRVNVGTRPVVVGQLKVGTFQLCDLAPAEDLPDTGSISPLTGALGTQNEDIIPAEVGCRNAPSIQVNAPGLAFTAKLAGLNLDVLQVRPLVLGLDDQKGGRVFGTLAVKLPSKIVGDRSIRVGVGGEVSVESGFRPISASVQLTGVTIPLPVPGVFLTQAGLAFDARLGRISGEAQVLVVPIKFLITGGIAAEQGELKQLSAAVGFGPPFPLTASIGLDNFGFSFQAGGTTTLATGQVLTVPARLSGTVGFVYGPPGFQSLPVTPENLAKLVRGFVTVTVGGPTLVLNGDVFAFGTAVKLGSARVLFSVEPFRFEARAKVAAFSSDAEAGISGFEFISGDLFLGADNNANFTGLGTVAFKVPNFVPVVGGKELASVQGLISNKAIGAVTTIDPPLVDPFTAGAAFVIADRRLRLISSLAPFITVTPSASAARVGGRRVASAADLRNLVFPRGVRQAIVTVEGATRPPRRVRFRSPGGRLVRAHRLPFTQGNRAYYALGNTAAGRWQVSSPDAIARLTVSRVNAIPYLDPRPGWGSRPRPTVVAGRSVPVCWNLRHAPRNAVVDLFEDTNGRLGTGRQIASGLPLRGCHRFSTAGLEPGKHWVYGTVRVGDVTLSARYWPIGINVVDPRRLSRPGRVRVRRTDDGAYVRFAPNRFAAYYIVRADPVGADAAPVEETLTAEERPDVTLSLRGARAWDVTVQGVSLNGRRGNISRPRRVAPRKPLVAAGNPNGVAEVGKRWAFQLELGKGVRVRLLQGPPGLTLSRRGLARWTPSARAGSAPPQTLRIRACRGRRCIVREWSLSAQPPGTAPSGPARGFEVTPNVIRPQSGQVITIRAQGIDQQVTVKVDGRRVHRIRRISAAAIQVHLPRLRRGPHDVSLRIGRDLEETKRGAIVVLP